MICKWITGERFAGLCGPFCLVCVIIILSEVFAVVLSGIYGLTRWGRLDHDLMLVGALVAFAVSLLIAPLFIGLIRHGWNLRQTNRRLQAGIAERTRGEDASRANEELLRRITDSSRDVIWLVDTDLRYTFVNPAIERMLGYRPDEFMGKSAGELGIFPPEYLEKNMAGMGRVLQGETVLAEEYEVFAKDGTIRYVEITGSPIISNDEVVGMISVGRDMTERKFAEESARETEELYRSLANNIPDIIYSLDRQGNVMTVSENALQRYGFTIPELMGKPLWAFCRPADRDAVFNDFEDAIRRRREFKRGLQFRADTKNGTSYWFEMNAHVRFDKNGRFLWEDGVLRDITAHKAAEAEKARLENQLRQSQKLEAIGTLAGGMAHDFNNLLMGIQGYASLMLLDIDESHPHYDRLRHIEAQVQSGADLTRQLLGFAREGRYEIKPTDLNDVMRKTSDLFGRTKKEIAIHGRFEPDLWPAEVDRGQIEQALLNLYVHAGQAMPGGGQIYLETRNVGLDEGYATSLAVAPGPYVKISVTDTGAGMDEQTKERIFEPFFTTKEMGRGAGLGLAMVYGIIRGHQGIIHVWSEKGHGTTFHIYLPASEKAVVEKNEHVRDLIRGGKETILVIDDEETIRTVTRKLLEGLGYKVMTAGSGKQALEIFVSQRGGIDLVLLDMIMPGMSGEETFNQLKAIDPDGKVILSSGYGLNGPASGMMDRGCLGFIQKPFDVTELSQLIRTALDRRGL